MSMSKKDYELIADILRRSLSHPGKVDDISPADWRTICIAQSLAYAFAADNPRFNPDLFRKAAGVA